MASPVVQLQVQLLITCVGVILVHSGTFAFFKTEFISFFVVWGLGGSELVNGLAR